MTDVTPTPPEAPSGRSVLVTGGNRGIGRAIAEAFVAQGDRVAVTTRTGGAPDGTLDVRCDVTDPEAVDAAFRTVEEAHGPVEVLVANAGVTHDTLLLRMSEEDWSSVIETNLNSMFNVTKQVVGDMVEKGWGRIINISSVNGAKGQAGQTNYSAAKAGMHGFTMALAQELAAKGVTVNTVRPGYIGTDMVKAIRQEVLDKIVATIPVKRLGEPSEIASIISWLATDEGGYSTGADFSVNGGLHMH